MIEDEQEFAHAGDQGDHLALTVVEQASIERADDGITSGGDERGGWAARSETHLHPCRFVVPILLSSPRLSRFSR